MIIQTPLDDNASVDEFLPYLRDQMAEIFPVGAKYYKSLPMSTWNKLYKILTGIQLQKKREAPDKEITKTEAAVELVQAMLKMADEGLFDSPVVYSNILGLTLESLSVPIARVYFTHTTPDKAEEIKNSSDEDILLELHRIRLDNPEFPEWMLKESEQWMVLYYAQPNPINEKGDIKYD